MKRTTLIVAIVVLVIGCISCDSKKEKTKSDRFPGFTQIGPKGELANLYLDLNFIKRENDIVKIKFIRVVKDGYVIQEGATDCQNSFQGFDGVQYKDDGTSDRKYPGDATPKPYQNLSGIADLINTACNKTGQIKALSAISSPDVNPDEIHTRHGKLRVVTVDFSKYIELNGKIIKDISNDLIELNKYFKLKDKDVVLISEDCGGSACGYPSYFFITIDPDGSYTKSETFDGDNLTSATQKNETITVIFKRYIDKSIESIVTYKEGKISIDKVDNRPTKGPASEENCKGLYKVYDNCGDDVCSVDEMSLMSIRAFSYYTEDKRLKIDSFDKLCDDVCKTKMKIGYQEFKKEICGY